MGPSPEALGYGLPDAEERAALVAALAELCQRRGGERLRTAPLEPSPRWFPDRWDGDAPSAVRLAERFLGYAGLGHLAATVEVGAPRGGEDAAETAAWFAGIEGGRARFGIAPEVLADPEWAAGALAHEVAHAWRRDQGLGDPAAMREELLTDATTVYLGFGVLTANAALRVRTSGELRGGSVVHRWSNRALGYLSPGSMAFLLAAQVVAQGAPWHAARRVRRLLEPNQAHAFAAACRHLRRDARALRHRLGFPASVTPHPRPLPLRAPPPGPPQAPPAAAAGPPDNSGRAVFRVRRREPLRALGAALVAAWFGGSGLLLLVAVPAKALGASGATIGRLAVAAAIGGALLGLGAGARHLRLRYSCSDPGCDGIPGPRDATCPGCHGEIGGTIRRREDRLVAEEALEEGRAPLRR